MKRIASWRRCSSPVVAFATILFSIAGAAPGSPPAIYCEMSHENYAWGFRHRGIVLDDAGHLYSFSLMLVLWLICNSTMAADRSHYAAAQTDNDEQAERSLTPSPGGPERRAILDALRMELGPLTGPDLVFVVEHLKVRSGWAWIHAFPQTRDGRKRYEDVSALLRKQGGRWSVQHLESGGEDCAEEPDAGHCGAPAARFPAAPPDIFTLD